MSKKPQYVSIPNKAFAFETDYYLENDELLVYYHVCCCVSARNPLLTLINVDMLSELITFQDNNTARKKKRIRDAVVNLHEKGYFSLSTKEEKIKNSTLLNIHLFHDKTPLFELKVRSGSWNYKGYTQIYDEEFNRVSTPEEFKVLIYTKLRSFENLKEDKCKYAISFFEWASVLKVTHATAVKIINQCVENKIIIKHSGEYYLTTLGKVRQDTNKYELKTETEFEDSEHEVETQAPDDDIYVKEYHKSTEQSTHGWFYKKSNYRLTPNDMVVYFTTECNVLKKHAEKRIRAVSKSSKGKAAMDNLMNEARIMMDHTAKRIEYSFESGPPEEYVYVKRKRKRADDISDLLD
ncbi:hypothetical protein [Priestia koreensis]|uniref:hypothetical protein n=1 Tax=Priestia koreensis TaxID=284581 RepID=UPI0030174A04